MTENNRTLEHEKSYNFLYTLHDVAQEKSNDIVVPADWNAMQALFCRYFSIWDRSVKHLHERGDFKFDLHTDDLKVFISDVKKQPISSTIII